MVDVSKRVLDTIWEVPDAMWARIEPLLSAWYDRAGRRGQPHVDFRPVVNGIIFRMRTGAQWNQLPRKFGADSTVHRWFQRWNEDGVWRIMWAVLLTECDELGDVDWRWQAADGVMNKARFGGQEAIGPNPTDRAKPGVKKSITVERRGGPTGVTIAGANRPDCKMLSETINAIVVERPDPAVFEQNMCLDKGYDNPSGHTAVQDAGYIPHIRRIGEEKLDPNDPRRKNRPARRWVVERTIAWLQKCRGILIRYDKKDTNYLGLVELACALLWYRRLDAKTSSLAAKTPA